MNPQDPLAGLNPLREPAAIGGWPPAPGWWLLLVLGCATVALIGYLLWRRHQRNAYRRRALRQLDTLQTGHKQSPDDRRYVTELNALLKSVALLAYPARDVASQHGEPWLTFLNDSLPPPEQFTAEFEEATYRSAAPEIDAQQLYRSARYWIRHHKVTS